MSTGALIYLITMGWTLIILGGITYLFRKKQDYTLVSGFSNRPDEEKEFLKESGYIDALGRLLTTTFYLFLAAFIFGLLKVPFAFEISLGVFILVLMIGIIWIQRYEVPHKRKKMFWITGIISAATIIFIAAITGIGYIDNKVNVHENTFEITGMYGVEWNLAEIEKVELLNELPKVEFRTNGFAISGILKGRFTIEEPYGNGLLFIQERTAPYLYVATNEEYVIINRKNSSETKEICEDLLLAMDGISFKE